MKLVPMMRIGDYSVYREEKFYGYTDGKIYIDKEDGSYQLKVFTITTPNGCPITIDVQLIG